MSLPDPGAISATAANARPRIRRGVGSGSGTVSTVGAPHRSVACTTPSTFQAVTPSTVPDRFLGTPRRTDVSGSRSVRRTGWSGLRRTARPFGSTTSRARKQTLSGNWRVPVFTATRRPCHRTKRLIRKWRVPVFTSSRRPCHRTKRLIRKWRVPIFTSSRRPCHRTQKLRCEWLRVHISTRAAALWPSELVASH